MAKIKHDKYPIFAKSYDFDFVTRLSCDECALQLAELDRRTKNTVIEITQRGDLYPFQVTHNLNGLMIVGHLSRWSGTGTRIQARIYRNKWRLIGENILFVLMILMEMVIGDDIQKLLAGYCGFPVALAWLVTGLLSRHREERASQAMVMRTQRILKAQARQNGTPKAFPDYKVAREKVNWRQWERQEKRWN